MDTMNLWIEIERPALLDLLKRVDALVINEGEIRQLTECTNLIQAGRAVLKMGPKIVVLKKGEHGALLFEGDRIFAAPAYPIERVFDPTGAGDTFAGGFLGYLAGSPTRDEATLRRAVVMGSTLASFCVEAFSLDRLLRLTRQEIDERFRLFKRLTHFETIE